MSFLDDLAAAPLIASVQGSPGSPMKDPDVLLACAKASLRAGVKWLRLEGAESIDAIRARTGAPTIGLLKREAPGCDIFITPGRAEVKTLLSLGCEVVALDGTDRPRPDGSTLSELIMRIHQAGRLAMADCDGEESIRHAMAAGADVVGTTLAGYTPARPATVGPDLDLLRWAVAYCGRERVIAEGRFTEPWQARAALRAGAVGIVIGGALNDPLKQTHAFLAGLTPAAPDVLAVDIGGTWLRCAVVSADLQVRDRAQIPLPATRAERLAWIQEQLRRAGLEHVGIGTGGVVDPRDSVVTHAKPLIPDHIGTRFEFSGKEVRALNDGLATAWGHACHPQFAGLRVATLALGTGVGFGLVDRGRLLMSRGGAPPHLNDLPSPSGATLESELGGGFLRSTDSALEAAKWAVEATQSLFHPDVIVRCGGVGLAPWCDLPGTVPSPFGEDAGLVGAACLALFPPPLPE